MDYFLQLLFNGVHTGALYALLAYGYVVMRGLTHRTDLAYGALFAFAGQTLLLVTSFGWSSLWLTLPAALGLGFAVALAYALLSGKALATMIYAPLIGGERNAILVATLGASLFLMEFSRIAAENRDIWLAPVLSAPIQLFGTSDGPTLTAMQVVNVIVVLAIILTGEVVLRRTRLGRIWRAVSDSPSAARMCGIDTAAVRSWAIAAAVFIGALAGFMATLYYGNISFDTGLVFGLKVLFVAAAGGLSLPLHAALGAFAVGIAEALWSGYFPVAWRDVAVFAALAMLLILRRPEAGDDGG
jgi:branched-chain amino acid transport system permease protein